MSDLLKLQNGSDIRGVAMAGVEGENVNLTQDACYLIGKAFAQWLARKKEKDYKDLKVGVGQDSRLTGDDLSYAVAKGLRSLGVNVVLTGLSTTPSMFMSIVFDETKFDGAVMITASHLPFNRNGVKFFDADGGLESQDITDVLKIAEAIKVCDGDSDGNGAGVDGLGDNGKTFEKFDLLSLYAEHLKKQICDELGQVEKPLYGLRIVVDAGNGAAGFFVEKILKPLGCDTTGSQFLTPDGHFPNHIPNPENHEAMASIKNATVASDADLGLIFDTDVDRMSAVFHDGKEVNRDEIIALVAAILEPKYPGSTIVTDSVTSDRLTYFLEEILHLKHFRYMRGYKNVINKQKELNKNGTVCPLAMETSGHGALLENYFLDDGAYLAVKMIIEAAKAKKKGQSLESLIKKMPPLVEEVEYRFKITADDFKSYGKMVLDEVKKRAVEKNYILPESYEGVRLSFKGGNVRGWILLRMSLHDPVMPMNIEGERKGDVKKLVEIARELVVGFGELEVGDLEHIS